MAQFKFSFELTCAPLAKLAGAVQRISLSYAHAVGWPVPPNPTLSPSIRSGVETVANKIEVIFTPVDVNSEAFTDAEKAEISQWSLTPVLDGVDQAAIVKDKADLSEVTVLADQGVAVFAKWGWIDDAGNASLIPVNTETVLAADVTPPVNPQLAPGVRVGDEVEV